MQAKVKLKMDTNSFETYFGKDFPNFFGWVVPESEDTARLGIGCFENAQEHFYRFLQERTGKKDVLCWESGLIPVYNPKRQIQNGNVYLIGDAATQVKATTGGGIIQSLYAAEQLFKSIKTKQSYEKLWKQKLGNSLLTHLLIKKALDRLSDNALIKLVDSSISCLMS